MLRGEPDTPWIWRILRIAEQNGERCGGPVLLAGLVVGIGMVELSSGPLQQTSRFSLELLVLMVLQLVGPMLVSLLAMALLMPRWLERVQRQGQRSWRESVPAAALVGVLLLLMFLVSTLCGGVITTPRADLIGELKELLGGILVQDVSRSMLRCGLFLGAICGWCQWRGFQAMRHGKEAALLVSNLQVEGLMVLFSLKLLWIAAIDPIHLNGGAAQ